MEKQVWMDGVFYAATDAKITALSQTVQYGFGVFEGIRSYKTSAGAAIFRLKDHIDRLFKSADLLKMNIPYSKAHLQKICCELIQHYRLENAYLRPVVFMGDEYAGLHTDISSVHVMIAAIPWHDFFITKGKREQGISLKTSSYERLPLKNGLNRAKANGLYLISILANNEARAEGYEEALLLDPHGFVAEGSGSNIFMVKNKKLYTPHLDFVLDGITRRTLFDMAKVLDLCITEKKYDAR